MSKPLAQPAVNTIKLWPMTAYRPDDYKEQTLLSKDGDKAFEPVLCSSLQEAIVEVRKWSELDQQRARLKIAGGREYTWADLKPHIDHL
jgi:hypothetical protein